VFDSIIYSKVVAFSQVHRLGILFGKLRTQGLSVYVAVLSCKPMLASYCC
jgi:hypothetical protein